MSKVRPWYGHADHIHVRLKCPTDSPDCRAQLAVPAGNGCDKSLNHWFADTFVIAAARADSERIATPPRDKFGSLITPWHVCRGTLRQCHLDECKRTPALSPPSRQAAYKRSPFRSNSRQLRCVDIKFFRSNGSSAVHFVNSANHRCGLPALSLMNRITISGPLNARRVQTSR
jgi:hypothetical protein